MPDPSIYIRSDMLPLVAALYFIGRWIKATDKIPNMYIPFILSILSIIACIFQLGLSCGSVIEGIIIAGCCTYSNELFKQTKNIVQNK